MAAPLARVSLVTIQVVWVRLDNAAIFDKQEAGFFGGHAGDEGFGFFEQLSQAGHGGCWVYWRIGGNSIEVFT